MANCDLCNQKLSFLGGETFHAGEIIQGVSIGETYSLCPNCMNLIKAAKKRDLTAKKEVYKLASQTIKDENRRKCLLSYLNIHLEDDEIEKMETEISEYKQAVEDYRRDEVARVMAKVKEQEKLPPIFEMDGCRGRSIKVYPDRVIITTSVTLGAVLTMNATDGAKTIFYHDVIGVQFKEPGLTIGYLQLETASGQMNNLDSNQFSENTFTYETDEKTVRMMKDYIIWQISQYKHI